MKPFIPASTSRPSRTCQNPAISSPTLNRWREQLARLVEDVHTFTASPPRCRRCLKEAYEDGSAMPYPRPIPGWSTANHRRTRVTCRTVLTWSSRCASTWPRWAHDSTENCAWTNPSATRWMPCWPAGATIRRNPGIRSLAVYNPIHYQELAGTVYGLCLQPDRQITVNHRRRQ